MANEMPNPDDYRGLSRNGLQYGDRVNRLVQRLKKPDFSPAEWASIEELVDVKNFERMGVFLGDRAETTGWAQYKQIITQYAGMTSWEGPLRRITEVPNLVILELEERNTTAGVMNVSNTVTIYEF